MVDITLTSNLKLSKLPANLRVWAQYMNDNLAMIDAAVAGFIQLNDLRGAWSNSTVYAVGDTVIDTSSCVIYQCLVAHTSSTIPTTFSEERTTHDDYWGTYTAPARARGVWVADTVYALNDFVVDGSRYAICIEAHTSSSSFDTDLALNRWSVLVDLSSVGSAVLPEPGGANDADKFATTNSTGTGYTIKSVSDVLTLLDATTIGQALLQAASTSAARAAINAQVAGSYQALDAALTSLSGSTIASFGKSLLALASASDGRTALGLGSAATKAQSFFAQVANNLSDLANAATARSNLAVIGSSGFLLSAGSDGYIRLPTDMGNLTIQWKQFSVTAGFDDTGNWPRVFSGGPYVVVCSPNGDTTGYVVGATTTTVTIANNGANTANFFVIGLGPS